MKGMLTAAATVLLILAAAPAWGHGTEGATQKTEGILVSAEYDGGEPMSYAAVEITGPDSGIAFQKGRTDRNGAFMFLPDRQGKWQIVVKDRLGHRLVLERQVQGGKEAVGQTPLNSQIPGPPVSKSAGIISGISIIFGLSGFTYGFRMRSRRLGSKSP